MGYIAHVIDALEGQLHYSDLDAVMRSPGAGIAASSRAGLRCSHHGTEARTPDRLPGSATPRRGAT